MKPQQSARQRSKLATPITVTMTLRSWIFVWLLAMVGALYAVVGLILVISDVT